MKDKNVYVLWSGGMDSTFLIQHLLDSSPTTLVQAAYVELINNRDKTKSELKAINKMLPYLRQKYSSRFSYQGTASRIELLSHSNPTGMAQMPLWLSAIMTTTPRNATEIAVGYVMNDCAMSYMDELRGMIRSYRKLCMDWKFPNITFPLAKYNKELIRDKIALELEQHVVWCEMPRGDNHEPCGRCVACERNPYYQSRKREEDFLKDKSVSVANETVSEIVCGVGSAVSNTKKEENGLPIFVPSVS